MCDGAEYAGSTAPHKVLQPLFPAPALGILALEWHFCTGTLLSKN